ncbi:2OG-Fe dioxygenase family protein [Bartonella sp. DB5-6]|uniref:2OG-Fe dioxygenase family protein n=1 Tax=Bartonella sp. DB5-6 TaxID=1094755 RepID=UPI00058AF43B
MWDVFIYQFCIEAKKGIQGNPISENIHKDGHTFINMHMIDKHNIEGSTSYIYDKNRKNKRVHLQGNLRREYH